MGETLDYLNNAEENGEFDGEFFLNTDEEEECTVKGCNGDCDGRNPNCPFDWCG